MNETKYVSKPYKVTQEFINKFAKASGGNGKIHVDPKHAKNTKFKGTLAHGFHLLSLIEKELTALLPRSKSISLLEVKFIKPVKVEQSIKVCCEQDSKENQLIVSIINENNEIAVIGTAII
ncbi:MaoC family dehydratase [Bacillus sp. JJ1532]|uniref:MaoC family dehydratase n=1 Tax=Bacillus sp. JJ1532 TaxID=3122958 RepID=UPI002FFE87D8